MSTPPYSTKPCQRDFRASRGFTLTELMVVIAIAAILLGIGVPSFNNAVLSSKLRSHANDLVANLHQARSEALKRNAPVRLCVSAGGVSCEDGRWEQGWILLNGTTVIRRQEAIVNGFIISSPVSTVDFQPTGLASTSTTFTICRTLPSVGDEERVITLRSTGRISTDKTYNASCS